jgi:hypothetical protein
MHPDDSDTELIPELSRDAPPQDDASRSQDPGYEAEFGREADFEHEDGPDGPPRRGGGLFARKRIAFAAALAAVLVIAFGIGTLPPVRAVLRQSFTRIPTPYAELYFTGTPVIDGLNLRVPVAIDAHVTAKTSYSLNAWLVDAAGKAGPVSSSRITSSGGITSTVLDPQLTPGAEVVWIDLVGQGQTLHFRIAGNPIPSSGAG